MLYQVISGRFLSFVSLGGTVAAQLDAPSATDPFPNSTEVGVAPSTLVMRWHTGNLVRGPKFTDYLEMPVSGSGATSLAVTLEVVNFATIAYSGTINATIGNKNWSVTPIDSTTISVPSMGRVTVRYLLTSTQRYDDTARLEAQATVGGKTSYAAEIFHLLGTGLSVPPAVQPLAPQGRIEVSVDTDYLHKTFGYDGSLNWQVGNSGGVGYLAALPSSSLNFTPNQTYKAPMFEVPVNFDINAGKYYVWVKAKASSTAHTVHIGMNGLYDDASYAKATNITGFSSTAWTWSRTTTSGVSAWFKMHSTAPGWSILNIWPGNAGVQISKIVLTTDNNFVPTN